MRTGVLLGGRSLPLLRLLHTVLRPQQTQQAVLLGSRLPRGGAPRPPHVGRPCRFVADHRALPIFSAHRLVARDFDLRQHGVRRRQDVFADGHTVRRPARAEGRVLVRPAHVFEQLGVLLELFDHLPSVQK